MNESSQQQQLSERLQRLESHFAHLEYQFEQLNAVVVEQGKTIDRLKKELQRQSETFRALEMDRIRQDQSKPPHYQ